MIQFLHRSIDASKWDGIVLWRAVTGREARTFDGAPLDVVTRWAHKDRARLHGHPEIQDAIGYAQGELQARGIAGGCSQDSRAAPARLQAQAHAAGVRV